ncbi:MAG: hypothetical protein PHU81_00335 [Acidobacteriota bacterium]|nr:hypothetical protein [Acidobacteriota bacterium]
MSSGHYLKSGFNQAISKLRLSIYLWLIIIIISLIIIAPISFQIRTNLRHLDLPQKALMPFELNLLEIILANQSLLSSYAVFFMVILLFSGLLSVFLNAGLFGQMLSQGKRPSFQNFLSDGCRHFWQFLLSLIVFIPCLLIFFLLFKLLSAPLNLWSARAVTEWPVIFAGLLRGLVLALLWSAFKLCLDLVRIIMITESKKVIAAYFSALNFFKRHFLRLWGLYLLLGLVVILISVILLLLNKLFSSVQPVGLLMLILLGQAFILFRLLARQAFIGLEFSYYSVKKESSDD